MIRRYQYLVFLCCLFIMGADIVAQTEAPVCRVRSIIGSVKIRRNGTVNWLDARPKMPLRERDAIRTLMESEAELETEDGSIIKVSENSTMELSKLQNVGDVKNTKIKIMSGSIISNVKKLVNTKSTFEFETPTATAAIRGTIVGFDVGKESTTIKVYEGVVFVARRGASQGSLLNNKEMAKISRSTKEIVVEKLEAPAPGTIPGNTTVSDSSAVTDTTKSESTTIDTASADTAKTDSAKVDTSGTEPVIIDTVKTDTIKVDTVKTDTIKVDTLKNDTVRVHTTNPDSAKTGTRNSPADTSRTMIKPDTVNSILPKTSNTIRSTVRDTMAQSGFETPLVKNTDTLRASPQSIPLKLILNSPSDGSSVNNGGIISVSGTVIPANATVSVNGRQMSVTSSGVFRTNLTAPQTTGNLELLIVAESNGKTQNITRNVSVKSANLILTITSPKDGQVFTKPLIIISGSVTSGATVSVMSSNIPVSASGTFTTQLPVANEEGEIILDFEAQLDSKVQKISRKVYYKPEYRFMLNLPLERQTVSTTTVQIKGEVLPVNSEVYVEGRKMSSTSSGTFSGYVTIADVEGEVNLSMEVISGTQIRNEKRTIIYKRPPDTYPPQIQGVLPLISQNALLYFTVLDRTVDEEITFCQEIDGIRETETGYPNSPFSLSLQEGTHSYTVYAVDKAGNQSQKVTGKVTFLGKSIWLIKLRKPAGDIALDLPPSAPDGSYRPVYTIEFSIDNLPNEEIQLIREISVTNTTTGQSVKIHTFTDTYNQVDINLKRKSTNIIIIEALDINNVRKTQKVQLFVR